MSSIMQSIFVPSLHSSYLLHFTNCVQSCVHGQGVDHVLEQLLTLLGVVTQGAAMPCS